MSFTSSRVPPPLSCEPPPPPMGGVRAQGNGPPYPSFLLAVIRSGVTLLLAVLRSGAALGVRPWWSKRRQERMGAMKPRSKRAMRRRRRRRHRR